METLTQNIKFMDTRISIGLLTLSLLLIGTWAWQWMHSFHPYKPSSDSCTHRSNRLIAAFFWLVILPFSYVQLFLEAFLNRDKDQDISKLTFPSLLNESK